jgi:ribosomal protein L37E
LEEVVSRLGLDILGLNRDQYREMLKPIIEGLLSTYTSRPSSDSIIARLRATAQNVYVMASAYLLEKFDRLTPEQLEFVVANGGPVAGKYAPKLYKLAIELGRTDLIPQIRYLWEVHGSPTPIECPRCGFRAVTPDLTCIICGYEAKEREVKEAIDFREKLRMFVEEASPSEIREVLERGYVLVGETVKPPSAPREPFDLELRLERDELEFLRKAFEVKRSGS